MLGRSLAQTIGGSAHELVAPLDEAGLLDRLLDEADRTRRIARSEARRTASDASRIVLEVTPLAAGDRVATGYIVLVCDLTPYLRRDDERRDQVATASAKLNDAVQMQRRLAFLAEVSTTLASPLDYRDTLQKMARVTVPSLADYCIVDLYVGKPRLERVAIAHWDPQRQPIADLALSFPPDLRSQEDVATVVREAQFKVYEHFTDAERARLSMSDEHEAVVRAMGPCSLLMVPIVVGRRVLGVITMAFAESRRHYTSDDVEVGVELGRRAGLAIENARLYAQMEEAVRAREELVAMVSHDLKNPVAAVMLSATVIERHTPEDASGNAVRRATQNIRRSAERMQGLIGDLLDMAKIDAGRLQVTPTAQDASAILDEGIDLHALLSNGRAIRIVHEEEESPLPLRCDRGRVLQVLSNLIGNALRYTPDGGTIALSAHRDGDDVVFSVRDEGPGIAEEAKARLFERFWRAEHERSREGAGLGLYIVKGIVEAHGGRIWVESTLGHGSTFRFALPIDGPPRAQGE